MRGWRSWSSAAQDEWRRDCLRWGGRVLVGEAAHWCDDWDGLPVDETTPEWDACGCFGPCVLPIRGGGADGK